MYVFIFCHLTLYVIIFWLAIEIGDDIPAKQNKNRAYMFQIILQFFCVFNGFWYIFGGSHMSKFMCSTVYLRVLL